MILDVLIFLLGLVFFLIGGRQVLSIGEEEIELREEADRQGDRYTWSRQMQFFKMSCLHDLAGYLATAGFFMMAYEIYKLYKALI